MTSTGCSPRRGGGRRRVAGAVAALLIGAGPALAAADRLPPGRFSFRTYGAAEGLGNLAVEGMAQDDLGLLWIATQDGLYRFDGHGFTRFGVEDGLPSVSTTFVATDRRGRLWVGTTSGLARGLGRRFQAVPPTALPPGRVLGLAPTSGGGLLVGLDAGLFAASSDGSFRPVGGWRWGRVDAVLADPARPEVAWASHGTIVSRRDALGRWTHWPTGLSTGEAVDALAIDHTGRLWASSSRHLVSLGPGEQAFRDETDGVDRLTNAVSRSFLGLDRSGSLWVPTDSGLYHHGDGGWRHLGREQGLPGGWAQGLFHDREGSLWVWQAGVGLHRILGGGLWEAWSRAEGLPGDLAWSILRSRSGRLWVGTSNGLAYARPERWGVMPGTDGLTVRTLAEAADGTLWLGCAPTLLVHLDPATGAVRRFGAAEGVTGGKILDLLVAGNGDVWVATRGSGLLRKPRGEDAFRPVPSPRDTMFVSEDRSGRIWFGGRGPGARLSVGRPSQWRHFTTADGLLGNDLMLIQETPDGGMWVAYADSPGLSRVRLQGDGLVVLEHRTQSSGLTGITYFLGFDRRGRLWRGTGGGIDVLGDEGVLHFDTSDGLVGDDCAFQAFWADAGGDVLVGTSRGLGRYRAGEEGTPPAPPTTLIVEARLGSRAMGQGDPELTVPRRLDTLWVRFSGLSFANERRVAHQVRLLGLETDWVDSGAREVRYPALPPGRYLFEARARIGEREWGPAARLRFRILPAWWETWPARGLQAVLALALVAGFFRLRLRRLQRQKERLARLVSERTADLRVANDELQRLSQSDALTGLANRRAFDGRLARALARARRDGTEMTLLLLDLDCFKQFNDRYGHPAGDECLRRVAGVLGSAGRRPDDLAARYGGEEFGLVLPGAGPRVARSIADRIRHEVVGLAIPHDASTVAPVATVSIGVASTTPGVEATAASLLAAADEALYRAKAKGRNRVELAELDPSARFRPGVVPLRPPATARPTTGGPGDPTAGGVGARPAAAGAGGARRFPRSVE